MANKRFTLAPGYSISRIIKGGWQLSRGHGPHAIDMPSAIEDMRVFVQAGVTTFDCGDIYLGVEELIGCFLRKYGSDMRRKIQLHTKYVPDINQLRTLTFSDTESTIDRSRERLGVDTLDLVQFHWWDYDVERYLEVYEYLFRLKDTEKIRHVGVTNFDVVHMERFVRAGLKPLCLQLQYSVLDRRPEQGMMAYCREHGINVLAYGTAMGGLLSEQYLDMHEGDFTPTNRSLIKYKLILEECGGWDVLQKILRVLKVVAQKHHRDMATVASAFILQKPGVAGVIVGARDTSHLLENIAVTSLQLDQDDLQEIDIVQRQVKCPLGDVYQLERYSDRHSSIMHKSNNAL